MQIINTEYFRGNYKEKRNDILTMVVKHKDGTKERKIIEKPKFRYYMTKPELFESQPEKYNRINNFISVDDVVPIDCDYMSLMNSIVNNLNDPKITSFYRSALYSKQDVSKKLNQIHLDYRLHGTDKDIQDYYIDKFLKKYPYQENNFGLHKCFFDIEVDSSEITGFPEPEYALCPVNAITLVDINTKKIYTYALSYEGNEGYDNWLQILDSFKERIIKRYKDELNIDFTLDIFTFDNEIMLIKSFFDVINNDIKPDFVCA